REIGFGEVAAVDHDLVHEQLWTYYRVLDKILEYLVTGGWASGLDQFDQVGFFQQDDNFSSLAVFVQDSLCARCKSLRGDEETEAATFLFRFDLLQKVSDLFGIHLDRPVLAFDEEDGRLFPPEFVR